MSIQMSFLKIIPRDIWYIISKFLTFELISLFDKTPYPEDSYVYREYYEQEIGGTIKKNYKQETIEVLKKIKDFSSDELLTYSCQQGYLGLLKTSISKGAAMNITYPLLTAARLGHLTIVRYVIELMPESLSYNNYKVLYLASLHGHLDIVKYLTKLAPESVRADSYAALTGAAGMGKLDVVKYLIKLDPKGLDDYEPLISAVLRNRLDVVRYLIELDPEGVRARNSVALKVAMRYGDCREIVLYLLSKGADISVLTDEEQKLYSS